MLQPEEKDGNTSVMKRACMRESYHDAGVFEHAQMLLQVVLLVVELLQLCGCLNAGSLQLQHPLRHFLGTGAIGRHTVRVRVRWGVSEIR